MQTERRTKQIYLFFMLRCRLSSHLQQSNANRTQNKTDLSVFYAEVPLIFAFTAKHHLCERAKMMFWLYLYLSALDSLLSLML